MASTLTGKISSDPNSRRILAPPRAPRGGEITRDPVARFEPTLIREIQTHPYRTLLVCRFQGEPR